MPRIFLLLVVLVAAFGIAFAVYAAPACFQEGGYIHHAFIHGLTIVSTLVGWHAARDLVTLS